MKPFDEINRNYFINQISKKMKKNYLFLIVAMAFLGASYAQVALPQINPKPANQTFNKVVGKNNVSNKTKSCTDTIQYPLSKLSGIPEIDTMEISNYISGYAQAYHFTGSGTVDGINAYVLLDNDGVPGNSSPITMTIKVYNIDANNDITTLIDSANVQIVDVGLAAQPLMFGSPVAVTDSFAVALEINPSFPANPYYVTNVSVNNDGNGEKLSSAEFAGAWYNAFDDFAGWDIDMMLEPIFTQNVSSSFTTDVDSICPNQKIVFTNTSNVNMDPMFNLIGSNPLYTWDFDDGTGTFNVFDSSYAYTSPGSYDPQLETHYYGYTTNCIDSFQKAILIFDTAVASFTYAHLGGGVYQFTNTSTSAMTFSWDFGDGSPLDTAQAPSHTYTASNNYTVCLTVTDSNGCNVDSACQTITFTLGVENVSTPQFVSIYPVPANKFFNVSVPTKYHGGTIVVTDVVGKTLKQVAIESQEEVRVFTENISSGIYFVSIDYFGDRVFTKRIVIDK
jgi:hypothetical protein